MTRCLLAEPNAATRLFLKLSLREAGHEVIEVLSVRGAVQKLAVDRFDLVLVSDGFDNSSAVQVIAAVKAFDLVGEACFVLLSDDPLIDAELEMQRTDAVVLPTTPPLVRLLWVAQAAGSLPMLATSHD